MVTITDNARIDRLLSRRVVETIVQDDLRKRLASGDVLRIKLGVDPTAPDIHIGNAVVLKKLREFQDLGHTVIFLIGDYTSLIGDPSGKSKTRPMLTKKEIEANAKTWIDQAGKILDMTKVEVRRNSEWFAGMTFSAVVELASQFTVARMIERDDFEKRLKEGTDVHMHELMYPMMQAYDSVMLEADVEIGGTDQRFNILAGRELQKKLGKRAQNCMFLGPILVGTDGVKKMSKSLGNYIGVTDSPEDMYGKTMSIPDDVMRNWFALTTEVDEKEIDAIMAKCERGEMNPRDAKARLAREIVAQYHSMDAAAAAEEHFTKLFKNKDVPDEIPELRIKAGERMLIDLLVETELASSKSEARRLIEQGGVKVDNKVVADIAAAVNVSSEPILLQKGKRHFLTIVAS
jgi:tyrosyl-tRNA synthetase